jgi:hypothetical protein
LKKKRWKPKRYVTLNKIIAENFPNLKKVFPIQVQEASRTPNRLDQNRISPQHSIIKTTSIEKKQKEQTEKEY